MMNVSYGSVFIIFFVVLFIGIPQKAIALIVNESDFGDFVHGLPYDVTTNIGILDVGSNTVSGNVSFLFPGSGGDRADEFNFDIGNGEIITSVVLSFSNVSGYSGVTSFLRKIDEITIPTVFFNQNHRINFNLAVSSISLFENVLPSGQGTYQLTIPGSAGVTGNVNMDYSWNIEVARIPEPASFMLLISGFMGLLCNRKILRRSNN